MTAAITTGTTIHCPHGGTVGIGAAESRVRASGRPIATTVDQFPVTGCPFEAGGELRPFVAVEWVTSATRVLIEGHPPILQTNTGLALSATGIPAGTPIVAVQPGRVSMI